MPVFHADPQPSDPLVQNLIALFLHGTEQKRAQDRQAALDAQVAEDRRRAAAQQDFAHSVAVANLRQAAAAETSAAQAPGAQTAAQAGIPEIGPEEGGPLASQILVKQPESNVQIKDPMTGQTLSIPLRYKEQVIADANAKAKASLAEMLKTDQAKDDQKLTDVYDRSTGTTRKVTNQEARLHPERYGTPSEYAHNESEKVRQENRQAREADQAQAKADKEEALQKEVEAETQAVLNGNKSIENVPAKLQSQVTRALQAQGGDTRTSKQKGIDADAQSILTSLDQLEEISKRINTHDSQAVALAAGGWNRLTGPLSEDVRLFDSQSAKLSQLARRMGEKGTLTDKDIVRVQNLLPGLTDDAAVAQKKLKDVREILVAGFRETVSKKVDLGHATSSGGSGPITVTAPNGRSYNFPDQASADVFKQRAGIQ